MVKKEIYEEPWADLVVCNLEKVRMIDIISSTTGGDGGDPWEFDELDSFNID